MESISIRRLGRNVCTFHKLVGHRVWIGQEFCRKVIGHVPLSSIQTLERAGVFLSPTKSINSYVKKLFKFTQRMCGTNMSECNYRVRIQVLRHVKLFIIISFDFTPPLKYS